MGGAGRKIRRQCYHVRLQEREFVSVCVGACVSVRVDVCECLLVRVRESR